MEQRASKVSKLARFAETQPHAAHTTFKHGLSSEWTYLSRLVQFLEEYLQLLEDVIRRDLLPSLTGQAVSDLERRLLSLLARLGETAVCNPVHETRPQFDQASAAIAPMGHHICSAHEDSGDFMEALGLQYEGLVVGRKEERLRFRKRRMTSTASLISMVNMPCHSHKRRVHRSGWTTVAMDEHAFSLSRGDLRDAICLRYGWKPPHKPNHCSDGEPFTVEHALSCSRGGYVFLRHNEVRDLLTDLLSDTCNNVTAEPHLQPV